MNQKDFGPRLRKIRRYRNFTQQDISSKLNISRQAYSNYEQGRCMPPPDILADLSIILDVNLFLLFLQDTNTFQNSNVPIINQQPHESEINSLIRLYSKMTLKSRTKLMNLIIHNLSEKEI